MNRSDLIEKYIQGKASYAELEQIKQLMEEDPEFSDEIAFQSTLRRAVKTHERQKLKKRLQNLDRPQKSLWFNTQLWKVAAILLVGVGAWWMFNLFPDYDRIYAENFAPYPNIVAPVVRGSEPSTSRIEQAFRAYDEQNYAEAANIFAELYQSDTIGYTNFYHALSLMASDQVEEAVKVLENPEWQIPQNLELQTDWYLGLGHLKAGDTDRATHYLQNVRDANGAMAPEASKILKNID